MDFSSAQAASQKLPLAILFVYKYLYNMTASEGTKSIEFRGSTLTDLRRFPATARREAGYQLYQVQEGYDPDDWKPMNTVGQGVREIRIRDKSGALRVMYIANLESTIFVLHCFAKKTQKTSPNDISLASQRYRDLIRELNR